MAGASLYNFRDLDLMAKLGHEGDQDGWVETEAMARTLGLDGARDVASRLSWMRRYGMLQFDPEKRMWRLTQGGQRVVRARLLAGQAKVIEALPDEAMVEVMANVTSRYRLGDGMVAHMIRREFLFGTKPR